MQYKIFAGLGAVALMASVASATVITFDPLASSNDDPYVTSNESGYTVTATGGEWHISYGAGNPFPSLYELDDTTDTPAPTAGELTITLTNGGQFSLSSFDLANNAPQGSAAMSYTITGLLGGSTVFTQNGQSSLFQVDDSLPNFETITSTSSLKIDTLKLSFTPSPDSSSYNVDNIVVVPEPASLGAMAASAMLLMRRRRR